MNYALSLGIRYDEVHWILNTFREDRKQYLLKLIDKYKQYNGQYIPGLEFIEFHDGTPEMEKTLRKECESKGLVYDIGTFPRYSQKDIRNARYVPFCSGESYNWTDYDGDGVPYNFYKKKLCDTCGICDLDKIPTPFRVSRRILEDQRDISSESNGIRILVDWAFEELRHELEPWVVWGDVEFADCSKFDVIKQKFIWIRPIHRVGAYTNSAVLQKCKDCGRPIEIRQRRSEDIFEMNKEIVESFKGINTPIVLAGNWFGEIHKGGVCHVNNDVFINPTLLEKIKKMKLKAFYNPEYVIHATDEPYDWDPLSAKK
jgi:hypothetical protein